MEMNENKEFLPAFFSSIILQYLIFEVDNQQNTFVKERLIARIEEDKVWVNVVDNMPSGAILYNYEENRIIFENKSAKNILKSESDD